MNDIGYRINKVGVRYQTNLINYIGIGILLIINIYPQHEQILTDAHVPGLLFVKNVSNDNGIAYTCSSVVHIKY